MPIKYTEKTNYRDPYRRAQRMRENPDAFGPAKPQKPAGGLRFHTSGKLYDLASYSKIYGVKIVDFQVVRREELELIARSLKVDFKYLIESRNYTRYPAVAAALTLHCSPETAAKVTGDLIMPLKGSEQAGYLGFNRSGDLYDLTRFANVYGVDLPHYLDDCDTDLKAIASDLGVPVTHLVVHVRNDPTVYTHFAAVAASLALYCDLRVRVTAAKLLGQQLEDIGIAPTS